MATLGYFKHWGILKLAHLCDGSHDGGDDSDDPDDGGNGGGDGDDGR